MILVQSRRASAQREGMQAPQCVLNFKNLGTTAGAHCFILLRISHWILVKDFLKDFIPRNKDDIKSLQYPFGVQGRFTREARRAEFDGVGWDGVSKVSFYFLRILWVYRLSIYLLIHEIKIVTNILMGFKI